MESSGVSGKGMRSTKSNQLHFASWKDDTNSAVLGREGNCSSVTSVESSESESELESEYSMRIPCA